MQLGNPILKTRLSRRVELIRTSICDLAHEENKVKDAFRPHSIVSNRLCSFAACRSSEDAWTTASLSPTNSSPVYHDPSQVFRILLKMKHDTWNDQEIIEKWLDSRSPTTRVSWSDTTTSQPFQLLPPEILALQPLLCAYHQYIWSSLNPGSSMRTHTGILTKLHNNACQGEILGRAYFIPFTLLQGNPCNGTTTLICLRVSRTEVQIDPLFW